MAIWVMLRFVRERDFRGIQKEQRCHTVDLGLRVVGELGPSVMFSNDLDWAGFSLFGREVGPEIELLSGVGGVDE